MRRALPTLAATLAVSGAGAEEKDAGRFGVGLGHRYENVSDDARFVGNVSWRQDFRSFDGAGVTQRSIPRTVPDCARPV